MRIIALLLTAFTVLVSVIAQGAEAEKAAADKGAWRLKSPGYTNEIIDLPKECKEADASMDLKALLYSPKEKQEGKVPLVVLLHGAGGTKQKSIEAFRGNRDVRWVYEKQNQKFKARYLVPHAWSHWNPKALDIAVDHLLEKHDDLDKDRVYCIGYSLGGLGTWNWARHSHQRLAAIILVGCKTNMDDAEKMKKLPIWAIAGTADYRGGGMPDQVKKKFVDELGSKKVKITKIEGAKHGPSAAMAWKTEGLLEWLFSHSLKDR